jgi:hypothetical protein
MAEAEIGCPVALHKELPKLLGWLERRVSRHKGSDPIDMVALAMLAA